MKTDEEIHEYAHQHPDAVVALIQGAPPSIRYKASTLGLKRTNRELDLGLLPEGPAGDAFLTEVVGYDAPLVERDLFEKAVLAASQHDLWGRVRPVTIYLERRFARSVLPPVLGLGIDLAPIRIFLDEVSPAVLLRRSPELFPLLPLSRVTWPNFQRHLRRWWEWTTRRVEAPERRIELQDRLFQFSVARRPDVILDEIRRAMEGIMSIRETRAGRDLIEIGREEGREEGLGEGEAKGLARAIRDVLDVRFGAVPEDVGAAVAAIQDADRLATILRNAARAEDLDAFRNLLPRDEAS